MSVSRRTIDISTLTIIRVIAAIVVIWLWLHLWQLLMLVVVAIVVAVALEPAVEWLERHRVPRGLAAAGLVVALALAAIVFFAVAGSSLADQARDLGGHIQEVRQAIAARVPAFVRKALHDGTTPVDSGAIAGYAFDAGRVAVDGLIVAVLALILTIYLLIEGRQTYLWLLAYAPRAYRDRVHFTAMEAREKILGYAIGNLATSFFASLTVFVALTALHVPAALLLALLAGLFDFVPVLGFICSAAPAILLAMTRSMAVALAVAAVYVGYHLAENYYIGPKVYGGRLRLSNLAVIIAFAVGADIGGIVGAMLALPIAALYPVIERVWLGEYLGREAVETHRRMEGPSYNKIRET